MFIANVNVKLDRKLIHHLYWIIKPNIIPFILTGDTSCDKTVDMSKTRLAFTDLGTTCEDETLNDHSIFIIRTLGITIRHKPLLLADRLINFHTKLCKRWKINHYLIARKLILRPYCRQYTISEV